MTSHNLPPAVDKNGHSKSKRSNAFGDLANVAFCVNPRIARPWFQFFDFD
jgi:hypothetical protein